MLSTSSSSGPAAPHGADPLGDAIVTQGLDDQPLNLTSDRTRHSTQEVDEALRDSSTRGKGKERQSERHGQGQGQDEDDEDFVVYEASQGLSRAEGSAAPSSSHVRRWSATLSNLIHPQQAGARPPSPSLSTRSSLESVSFGFRDNLLPLSLSGNDDDDYEEEDRAEKGGEVGRGRGGQEYGDVEGAITAGSHGRHRVRRKRYKDPERRMGLIDGIALTVGLQIGSGIFSSPGVVTLNTGSVGASLIVWIFSGFLAWSGASSFAELGAAIPENGGAQAYLNYAFGPLPSYLFSWTAIVALKPGSGAIIAIIFGEYLARVIFHTTKADADHPHEQGLDGIPAWSVKLIACVIVVVISALNAFSARLGTRLQVGTTTVKLIALVAVPILAIVTAARGKMPTESKQAFSSFGSLFEGSSTSPSSYALALYSGLWAYDGWDQSCYVAGEMKNVTRDLPRVIHSSMSLVITFFCLMVASYFLVLPPALVSGTNTVALDFGSAIFGTTGGIVFAGLVSFSCFGALNAQVYTSARLVYAAGKEGYLPAVFGRINSRTATPVTATVFQAVLILVFILFGSGFASLVSFYGVCSYTWYFLTVLGLVVLRFKEPNLHRPYRTFLPTPLLFATTALFLLVMPIASAPVEAGAAFLFMAAGLPAYFLSVSKAREGLLGVIVPVKVREWCGGRNERGAVRSNVVHGNGDEDVEDGNEEEAMEMLGRESVDTVRYSASAKGKSRAVNEDEEGDDDDDDDGGHRRGDGDGRSPT